MLWPHHSTFSKFQTLGGNFSFLHGSNLLLIVLLTCQPYQILLYYYDFYFTNVLSALNKEINTYHKLKFINSTHTVGFYTTNWFGTDSYFSFVYGLVVKVYNYLACICTTSCIFFVFVGDRSECGMFFNNLLTWKELFFIIIATPCYSTVFVVKKLCIYSFCFKLIKKDSG